MSEVQQLVMATWEHRIRGIFRGKRWASWESRGRNGWFHCKCVTLRLWSVKMVSKTHMPLTKELKAASHDEKSMEIPCSMTSSHWGTRCGFPQQIRSIWLSKNRPKLESWRAKTSSWAFPAPNPNKALKGNTWWFLMFLTWKVENSAFSWSKYEFAWVIELDPLWPNTLLKITKITKTIQNTVFYIYTYTICI